MHKRIQGGRPRPFWLIRCWWYIIYIICFTCLYIPFSHICWGDSNDRSTSGILPYTIKLWGFKPYNISALYNKLIINLYKTVQPQTKLTTFICVLSCLALAMSWQCFVNWFFGHILDVLPYWRKWIIIRKCTQKYYGVFVHVKQCVVVKLTFVLKVLLYIIYNMIISRCKMAFAHEIVEENNTLFCITRMGCFSLVYLNKRTWIDQPRLTNTNKITSAVTVWYFWWAKTFC